jgi:DNA repair protein RAD51
LTELDKVSGMNRRAARSLRSLGIATAELLAEQDADELNDRTKIGQSLSGRLISNARRIIRTYVARSGIETENESDSRVRLKTGVPCLDGLLLGGFEQGSIVEFYGPARTGKSQWCHQLAVTAQLPTEEGALCGRVLWLDTESSFKPLVLRAIALRFGLDPSEALDSVRVQTVVDIPHMEETFDTILPLCAKENYVLVVIDNLGDLYQTDYTALDEIRIRRQEFSHLAKKMRGLVRATGAIVVYTNRVIEKIGSFMPNQNTPLGGHVFAHTPDYRFYTRMKLKNERAVKLVDNVGLPEFEVDVSLGWGGFYINESTRRKAEPYVLRGLFDTQEKDQRWTTGPDFDMTYHGCPQNEDDSW